MKCINLRKSLGLLFMFMMIPLWAMSQNVTVTGSVKETGGDALPGVSIKQVGTSQGTITDLDGNYKLTVPSNAKLVFSFVGYQSETVSVGGKTKINVTVLPRASQVLLHPRQARLQWPPARHAQAEQLRAHVAAHGVVH